MNGVLGAARASRSGGVASRCLLLVTLLGALLGSVAPAQAASVAETADAVLAAVAAKDKDTLAALATEEDEDLLRPWVIADEVASRGAFEAAIAFARLVPFESSPPRLVAYLTRRKGSTEPPGARGAVAQAEALLEADAAASHATALLLLQGARPPPDTVLASRHARAEASALEASGAWSKAGDRWAAVFELGRTLGWTEAKRAGTWESARLAGQAEDHRTARRRWDQGLAAVEDDEAEAAVFRLRYRANIAQTHGAEGDYAQAATLYAQVLEELGPEDETTRDRVESNLGLAYASLGRLGDADECFRRVEERLLAEAEADRSDLADLYTRRGNLWKALGQPERAVDPVLRAVGLFRTLAATSASLEDLEGLALALGSLAEVYDAVGEPESAAEAMREALGLFGGPLKSQRNGISALVGLARILLTRGDLDGAESSLLGPVAAARALGEPALLARALATLGELHLARRRADEATEAFEEGLDAIEGPRGTPLERAELLSGLAQARLAAGDAAGAIRSARRGVNEVHGTPTGLADHEEATARSRHALLYEVGALASLAREDPTSAAWFLEMSRAQSMLRALGGARALREAAVPAALRTELEDATRAEAVAASAYAQAMGGVPGPKTPAQARAALDQAKSRRLGLEARVEAREREVSSVARPQAESLEAIQAALAPGDVLVLYGIFEREALALVATPQRARLVRLASSEALRTTCRDWKRLEKQDATKDLVARTRALLVEPLDLPPDTRRVLLSPSGPAFLVPPRAVLDEAWSFALVPSGSAFVQGRDAASLHGEGVLAVGGCDYGYGYDAAKLQVYRRGYAPRDLPWSGKEAAAIGDKGCILLAKDATIAGLKARLASAPTRRWRALHLAVHGTFDDLSPLLSHLALTATTADDQGFWKVLDIAGCDVPADLVTLSACQTALGKEVVGEGAFGLTRAFLLAGVPRVISSLWDADDEAASVLMKDLYARLRRGVPTAEALRQAQERVRKDPDHAWSDPAYWAGWVLWGQPD